MSLICKVLLSVALILAPGSVFGQSTFGEIRGAVTDASGAIMANAQVEAKRVQTVEVRKTVTDSSGNYSFVNLDAGTYEITTDSSGFRKNQVQGVILRAREIARVDVRLEVATATTEVQVSTARQVIQTDSSTIVDSKTAAQIDKLPVNFRAGGTNSVFSAISFTPGVQTDSGGGSISLGRRRALPGHLHHRRHLVHQRALERHHH